ncbi:hypothetical protein ACHQM5_027688 [Ranunculus cassubicifolius]
MAARWSEVPNNLLEDIFQRLFLKDHLGFSSVCSSWRSACVENRYLPSRRYVGLLVPGKTADSETRRLLEPVQGEYNNNNSPINVPVPHRYYCCGSSFGWLVLINDDLDMQFFNPISGAKLQLPSANTLVSPSASWGLKRFGKHYVTKAFLSCDPSSLTSRAMVLVIYGGYNLAFSIPGDKSWRVIATGEHGSGPDVREYSDAIFHKKKFYVVYNSAPPPGGVVTCDLSDIENPIVADYAPPPRCEIFHMTRYLVEANGDLFQLRRQFQYDLNPHSDLDSDCDDYHCDGYEVNNKDEVREGDDSDDDRDEVNQKDGVREGDDIDEVKQTNDEDREGDENDNDRDEVEGDESESEEDIKESCRRYRTSRFKVYKLIECNGCDTRRWEKVKSIGDNAFFVGYNSSFSLSTTDYLGCKPNSIYFTDCRTPYTDSLEPIRHDVGIFNLEDKSIQDIYPLDSKPVRPPAFWFTPIPW